jgi:hypothetical protein
VQEVQYQGAEVHSALFYSKFAELEYRLGKLKVGQAYYNEVRKRWNLLGPSNSFFEMLGIGRLAQIADKLDEDPEELYAKFMNMLGTGNPKRYENPVIANIVQSYAHYQWKKGRLFESNSLHQQAELIGASR